MLMELTVVEQRYLAVLEVASGVPVTEVAERYGVSRQSVHTWVRHYRADGMAGLVDRSHRPRRHPAQAPPELEAAICEMRRAHRRWGPRRIVYELGLRGTKTSRSTVYRCLVRHGLITPVARKRRRSDYVRWEREAPMELWQMDVTASAFLKSGREVKIVTGVDDHSRYCVCAKAVRRPTARAVCGALVETMGRYGVPEEILTDNGSVFTGKFLKPRPPTEVLFDRICRENGIVHLLTAVASPTTTGKIERLHQTLQQELLDDHGPFDDIEDLQLALDAWREEYNTTRPHQSLDMAIPAERFGPPAASLALKVPPELRIVRGGVPGGEVVADIDAPPDEPEPPEDWTPAMGLEVDRLAPASGNLGLGSQQIWLGPIWAGKPITIWVNDTYLHVSSEGRRIKTLPCRLSDAELRRLASAGARFSASTAAPVADSGAIEFERTVNAAGTVGIGSTQPSVGIALAGRRVTLRLEGELLHVIAEGELMRTLPCQIPPERRIGLRGARLAGPNAAVVPHAITVERRVSCRGTIAVANQRIHVGLVHAHKILRVVADSENFTIFDGDGELRVVKRKTTSEITVWKAHRQEVNPRASSVN